MKSFLLLCITVLFPLTGFSETASSKKTICLNMIVKNEKDVIERCLQSVLPIIDTWVIVDTGSDDGTQKIIEDFFKQKNIGGKLYERPWINFAYNRNEALALAKDSADYILFMDADDQLAFSKDFVLPELTAEFYATTSYDGIKECTLPRIVKASLPWKWEGVIHEQLLAEIVTRGAMLVGVDYIYNHDGARAKDPNTLLKDLQLLQSDPTPRNIFYTILTYQGLGKWEEALAACKQRIEMGGSGEEVFTAQLIKGKIECELKKDSNLIKESFLKAYSLRSHRWEPLYYLGKELWKEKAYEKGYELFHAAIQLPKQQEDVLFVETWIYDYAFLVQYMLFAAMTQHYSEGLKAADEVLAYKNLPEEDKKTALECKGYIRQQVIQEIQKKLTSYTSS